MAIYKVSVCSQTVKAPFAMRSSGQATKTMVKIFWPRS